MISRWICSAALCFSVSLAVHAQPPVSGSVNNAVSKPAARVFTMRLAGEPETLDWNLAHTMIETYILMNLMEGLVSFTQDLKVVPALAKSWSVSKDGKVYTFKLKPGVKWSDGVALRAQDFVYGWQRLLSPLTAASYAYFLFDIEGAQEFNSGQLKDFSQVGIKALDTETLQVRLKNPIAHWIQIPTFWVTFPVRQDVVEKHGSAWAKPGRMVTLGPFTLEAYEIDSRVVLRSNPLYHGKKGNIEQVAALIVKDNTTALNLYEAGKVDFLNDIATLDLARLSGRSDLKTFPYLKIGYLGFVVSKFPTDNVNVRRAIAMAIDKSKLESILHGGQKAATTFTPPPLFTHSKAIGLPFDVRRARDELRRSGLDPSQRFVLELLTPNWDKQLLIAQFVQDQLKKNLGLNVSVQSFDHKTFRAQMDLHAFPIFEGSWGADYPDPDNFLSVFLSNSGNNRTQWKSADYDQWVLRARSLSNRAARKKLYDQAQKRLIEEDAVLIPMYYEPNTALVKPRVQGLTLNPMNYLMLKGVDIVVR